MKKLIFVLASILLSSNLMAASLNKTDKKGRKQGTWQKTYKNGQLQYEGQFKDDVPYGTFKHYYDSGKLKSVQTYDANNNSDVTFYEVDGKTVACTGHFDGKLKVGEWKYFSNGELVLTEIYMNGVRHGMSKTYNKGAVMEETPFVNGQIDGEEKAYMEGGKLYSVTTYKNSVLNGPYKLYEGLDKPTQEGQFVDGKRSGVWNTYDDKGKLIDTVTYINGVATNQNQINKKVSADFQQNFEKAEKVKKTLPSGVDEGVEIKME